MGRLLGENRQALIIHDPVSGTDLTLYYRRPTSEERVAYQVSAFRLEDGRQRLCLGETRLKYGAEILLGFAPGDFFVPEQGSQTPLDPERHPDWKARLVEHAPDVIAYLGQQVFEGLRVVKRGEPEWD
jgi:hypothetical protein